MTRLWSDVPVAGFGKAGRSHDLQRRVAACSYPGLCVSVVDSACSLTGPVSQPKSSSMARSISAALAQLSPSSSINASHSWVCRHGTIWLHALRRSSSSFPSTSVFRALLSNPSPLTPPAKQLAIRRLNTLSSGWPRRSFVVHGSSSLPSTFCPVAYDVIPTKSARARLSATMSASSSSPKISPRRCCRGDEIRSSMT